MLEVGHGSVFSVCEGARLQGTVRGTWACPLLVALVAARAMNIPRYPISLGLLVPALHWPRAAEWFSFSVGVHGEEAET